VAPKTRPRLSQNERTTSRSVASTSRRSTGARSGATRQRSQRDVSGPSAVFLRGVAKNICVDFFDEDEEDSDRGETLTVWVDGDVLASRPLRGLEYVSISVVRPAGIEVPLDPRQLQSLKDIEASDAGRPTSRVVARLGAWEDAPDSRHAALSPALCCALDVQAITGGLIRIEPASQKLAGSDLECLKIYPFTTALGGSEGLRLGSQSKAARGAAAEEIKSLYASIKQNFRGLLDGPLTDGLVLPEVDRGRLMEPWAGGILRLGPKSVDGRDSSKNMAKWCIGSEVKVDIEVQEGITNPMTASKTLALSPDPLPFEPPLMINIEGIAGQLATHLSHCSSVLLTGGLGSGKSSLAELIGFRLRAQFLYHTTFFPCRKLVTDEIRISTIKETFDTLFMTAVWGTKLSGKALIILDDLDRLCPAETELQTSDNGRSRQISELFCYMVKKYCRANSGVVILATAQGKESVNNIIVGGHVVREIIPLKVPDKGGRRKVLQALIGQKAPNEANTNGVNDHSRNASQGSEGDEAAWMGGSPSEDVQRPGKFQVDRDLDLLDLAGQTDGYMPGDLVLLVSRAKNEALIQTIEGALGEDDSSSITLTRSDFQNALKGFTPASLRNVALQSSKTTFDSIGGLHETRKILLETLQYPTTYAPIFAQCPLRLRSGLLLYGYPGCGKTLLASAVAGECGLNFISVKGPEILNKYIGASEKSVRDLFERAESAKPCVLFFDEFDSIAPKRGHDSTGVTDRVVNQLLTQMDGAEGLSGVYVLAATSRPDLIDPALLRPGRLDKSLLCDMPSADDRRDIIQALSKKLSFSPAIIVGSNHRRSLSEVATRTSGYSGADLQAVIYNAHLEAIHDVLGDRRLEVDGVDQSGRRETKDSSRSSKKDILQFRFGKDISGTAISRAQQAAEYATLIAKLDAIRLARRKQRHARRAVDEESAKDGNSKDLGKGDSKLEVMIEWKHIEASLATTKSSIGANERKRLERIYREFVVGRNGEMPSGQGSTEVGGRSSLM